MADHGKKTFLDSAFEIGTPECAVLCACVAMVLALLILWLGLWSTLFIFLLMLLGAFIGGVKNKRLWCRDAVNRMFPPKTPSSYRREQRAPRHAAQQQSAPDPEAYEEEEPEQDGNYQA